MGERGAYYNENDKQAANWLRELIHEGHIAPGVVDDRSIRDVTASDLRGFVQCHWFAGIGVWSHGLRRAGWPDGRPVGTGSCPCQPFSAAGARKGFEDPRHLWPDWARIIREAREQGQRWADCIFGEQAATAGAWLDLVRADLEALGYAFGATDLPAAGFGGAHIRQRFYWVADADNAEWWADHAPRNVGDWPNAGRVQGPSDAAERGAPGWLADADGGYAGAERQQPGGQQRQLAEDGEAGWLGNAHGEGSPLGSWHPDERGAVRVQGPAAGQAGALFGCDWLLCSDARVRPVESGTFPLATEAPARLGRLRGYGNAIDAETARNFIAAYMAEAPGFSVAA